VPSARIEVGQLARIHAHLAQTIAPAKPRTILLLADEAQRGSLFFFLGPVPLVRRLMLIAALSLLVLFGVSLSGMVDGRPESFSLLSNSSMSLLLNELFLLSAAAIGACFSGLFQANRYISAGTFDPRQESSYWIRFALGLMAGVILATLVPIESFTEVKSGGGVQGSLGGLGAPALALLGGFSAAVVHRILYRLVSAIESVVKGDPHANLDNKLESVKGQAEQSAVRERLVVSAQLTRLQQNITAGQTLEEIGAQVRGIQDRLFPAVFDEQEDGAPISALGSNPKD